jgi:hypothetical protein
LTQDIIDQTAGDTTMFNKTTTFVAFALVLGAVSGATAAGKHPAHRHLARPVTAGALQSFGLAQRGSAAIAGPVRATGNEPDYMRIQDRSWGW